MLLKKIILSHSLSLLLILFIVDTFAQVDTSSFAQPKPKKFSLEIEPTSFFLKGFSGGINYHPVKRSKFSIGLFFVSVNVPNQLRNSIFNEVGMKDTTSARLNFQAALNLRYNLRGIKYYKTKNSLIRGRVVNPYIGLITGWEYFDINQPIYEDNLRISTYFLTPYIGCYFPISYSRFYINPQLRGVTYFGTKKSDITRPESLKSFVFLPQIGLGFIF